LQSRAGHRVPLGPARWYNFGETVSFPSSRPENRGQHAANLMILDKASIVVVDRFGAAWSVQFQVPSNARFSVPFGAAQVSPGYRRGILHGRFKCYSG
jgi:hypothetical protein